MSDLDRATRVVDALRAAVAQATASLAGRARDGERISVSLLDAHQTVAYDLATVASALSAAEHLLDRATDDHGRRLALAFAADVYSELVGRATGRFQAWGLDPGATGLYDDEVVEAVAAGRSAELLVDIAEGVLATGEAGARDLPEELEMVRDTFRRFAEDKVVPIAEHVHRRDEDVPEDIITGLAELGCFALSIPSEHGGLAEGGEDELLNMVLVTEELSRGSLGVAGSLITRPEIIGTAIRKGGTDEQKQRWLPAIASGERMCGVAVTEPDQGSDVAAVRLTATRDGDDWVLDGVKTWCTFGGRAEYLLVLARTDPDPSKGHRGLSLFVVEKEPFAGHAWTATQDAGGSMDARAIPTLGYRGMHSFEISFDGWRVPHANLIGEDEGQGRGFYLQMQAFANARLQTAARALGVMQSALESAVGYAKQRHVFASPLADYELTRTKIARMALLIAGCRAFTVEVARTLAAGPRGGGRREQTRDGGRREQTRDGGRREQTRDGGHREQTRDGGRREQTRVGDGQLEASQVKQLACRAAEWVTREAQQIHGGYGYAEEYTVSRLFVDARVLSIFEGADEVLALRVIARNLLTDALDS